MVPPVSDTGARVVSPSDAIVAAAHALSEADSLEVLSRPFLDLLHAITGLESTYLTEYRPERTDQIVRYADNRGDLDIPVGASADWQDSLCRLAHESRTYATDDVPSTFPQHAVAAELGLRTFLSVPVVGPDRQLMGTLCGTSQESVPTPSGTVEVMRLLAQLIADRWQQDRRHEEATARAAAAERRLRERASFLAEAEHKLKSPLTVIRGWTELLADDWTALTDPERDKAFSIMRRAGADAELQVQELLVQARGEVLSLQLAPVDTALAEVVQEVGFQLQGISRRHHVTVIGGPPVRVHVDRQALWQVLWHLGENAVKYSPAGGRIDLGWTVEGDRVLITTTDDGVGIPDGIDLFAPFVRGDRVEGINGTGLGLHIVRTLVTAMDGSVTAAAADYGSVFTVALPIVPG